MIYYILMGLLIWLFAAALAALALGRIIGKADALEIRR